MGGDWSGRGAAPWAFSPSVGKRGKGSEILITLPGSEQGEGIPDQQHRLRKSFALHCVRKKEKKRKRKGREPRLASAAQIGACQGEITVTSCVDVGNAGKEDRLARGEKNRAVPGREKKGGGRGS